MYQKCINARFSKCRTSARTIFVLPSFGAKRNRNPFKIRDCGIYLILIIDYSIIVATLPEPTVLPPSRNYFIIIWYILFDFSCFHCLFWLFVLPLFLFAKRNDDSLTTVFFLVFANYNLYFLSIYLDFSLFISSLLFRDKVCSKHDLHHNYT